MKMKLLKEMNKIIIFTLLISLIFINGCSNEIVDAQKEYNKCTAVCASVLEDDFVTMKLCMDECKEKFLDKE